MSRPIRVPRWWLLTEPGKARRSMASQRSHFSSGSCQRPPMSPRWVPKNVLCVEPVTMSAPSLNGCWKCGPTRPRTCAMSYMSTASMPAASRKVRTLYTGSGCSTMLLPRMMSSGRSFSMRSRSAGTSALYGFSASTGMSTTAGISVRGVHDREQPRHRRGRHLRGDEVDALVLSPDVVADGAGEQPQGLFAGLSTRQFAELRRVVPHDGAGAWRRVATHVVGHHEPGDALA